MNTLVLIRHSLTTANEQRLYYGRTDISLSENGRTRALQAAESHSCPSCSLYASSGMKRADETLFLLTGRKPDVVFPELSEMDFGTFEMHSYEQLLSNPDYIRWIEDETGDFACPGGESRNAFSSRVTGCADRIILSDDPSMLIVCHGGAIANIMQHWFPQVDRHFYQWQPAACGGYIVRIENGKPVGFEDI